MTHYFDEQDISSAREASNDTPESEIFHSIKRQTLGSVTQFY